MDDVLETTENNGTLFPEDAKLKKGNMISGSVHIPSDFKKTSLPHQENERADQIFTKDKMETSRKTSFEIVDNHNEHVDFHTLSDFGEKVVPRRLNQMEKYHELPAWLGNRKPSFELFPDLNFSQESRLLDDSLKVIRPENDQYEERSVSDLENIPQNKSPNNISREEDRRTSASDDKVSNRRRPSKTLDFLTNADNFELNESNAVDLSSLLKRKSPEKASVPLNNVKLQEHVNIKGHKFTNDVRELSRVDRVTTETRGSIGNGSEQKLEKIENVFHGSERLPKRSATNLKRRRSKTMEFKRSSGLMSENLAQDLKPKSEVDQLNGSLQNSMLGTYESSIERNHDLVYLQNDIKSKNREKDNEIRWNNKLKQLEKHLLENERRTSDTSWKEYLEDPQTGGVPHDYNSQSNPQQQGSKLLNFLMNSKHFDKAAKQNLFQAPSSTFTNLLKSNDGDDFQGISRFEERRSSQDDDAIFLNLPKRSPKYGKYMCMSGWGIYYTGSRPLNSNQPCSLTVT